MIIVEIAGRLGRDAETRFTQSGQKVTTLTLATNVWKGGKDETVWWRVTLWGDRWDKMVQYYKKGSAIIVVGEMAPPNIWTDKEGRPQVGLEMTAEIVKFNPFGGSGTGENAGANASTGTNASSARYAAPTQTPNNHGDSFGDGSSGYGGAPQAGSGARYSQTAPADDQLPF